MSAAELTEGQAYEILLAYVDAGNEPTADGRHPGPIAAQAKRRALSPKHLALNFVRPLTYRPTLLACFAGTLALHERFRSLAHLDGG